MMDNSNSAVLSEHRIQQTEAARVRLQQLCDRNSFFEFDRYAGGTVCCGSARIDGRGVFVYAFDAGVRNGAMDARSAECLCSVLKKAQDTGTPVVGVVCSGGVLLSDGLDAANGFGKMIKSAAALYGRAPHIISVEGPALGLMGAYVQCADAVIINENGSIGAGITAECMLKAKAAVSAGDAAIKVCTGDEDEMIKRVLSYLPDNGESYRQVECTDDPGRVCSGIEGMADDAGAVVNEVFDAGSFCALYDSFGKDILSGFAMLGGVSVGVIANNSPFIGGDGARKAARIISLCDAYSMPIIFICNAQGVVSDGKSEEGGTLCNLGRLAGAAAVASVPLITVITKEAVGSAYTIMGSKSIGADVVFAWNNARIGLVDAATAVAMQGAERLRASENPVSARKDMEKEYQQNEMDVYAAAAARCVDQPIEPENTRISLCAALDCLRNKRREAARRHVMPF